MSCAELSGLLFPWDSVGGWVVATWVFGARRLSGLILLPTLFIVALNHKTRGDHRMTTLATSDSSPP